MARHLVSSVHQKIFDQKKISIELVINLLAGSKSKASHLLRSLSFQLPWKFDFFRFSKRNFSEPVRTVERHLASKQISVNQDQALSTNN